MSHRPRSVQANRAAQVRYRIMVDILSAAWFSSKQNRKKYSTRMLFHGHWSDKPTVEMIIDSGPIRDDNSGSRYVNLAEQPCILNTIQY